MQSLTHQPQPQKTTQSAKPFGNYLLNLTIEKYNIQNNSSVREATNILHKNVKTCLASNKVL